MKLIKNEEVLGAIAEGSKLNPKKQYSLYCNLDSFWCVGAGSLTTMTEFI